MRCMILLGRHLGDTYPLVKIKDRLRGEPRVLWSLRFSRRIGKQGGRTGSHARRHLALPAVRN